MTNFSYILNKSDANKLASSPPVPALISMIAFLVSASSLGNKNNLIFSLFSLFFSSSFNSLIKSLISFSELSRLLIFLALPYFSYNYNMN